MMKNRSHPFSRLRTSALICALAMPALAQAQPDPSNARQAEEQYNIGKRAEDVGNLRLAAIHYKKAYDLYPTPALLYTLAHVHRNLGDQEIALDYYKRYVEADPNGPRVNPAKKYIAKLEAAIKQKQMIKLPDEGDEGDPVEPGGGGDPQAVAPDAKADPSPGDDPKRPVDRGGPDHTLRWAGVMAGAVGAAGLITGILYGLRAQRLSDDINNPGPTWDDSELDAFQEGEDAERNQIIFTIGGAALIAAGVTLVIIDATGGDSGGEPGKAVATPTVGRDTVGFSVSGRF